ncbi:hypothetical protein EP47_02405 [Legionella norrlandica]|uniref:Uncharacterized protein n=1 Tax=Legionella norrlandica TaxID=1498499 RepID=A0A0A2SLY3_9GAMM|nr:hypothetical protein EP47_02405 [Legionella norrlandica]
MIVFDSLKNLFFSITLSRIYEGPALLTYDLLCLQMPVKVHGLMQNTNNSNTVISNFHKNNMGTNIKCSQIF